MRKGLTLLGTHKGHKFYTFAAFDVMSMARKDAFLLRVDEHERFGIERDKLTAYLNLVEELVNAGNLIEVARLSGHLKYLLTLPVNTHMLAYIAAPLILIGGEDEIKMEPEEMQLKMQLAFENPEVLGFFLRCIKLLSISGKLSQDSKLLLESLENPENQQITKLFYNAVGV